MGELSQAIRHRRGGLASPISPKVPTARNQTFIDQAAIVCALERYHARANAYPEELARLAPAQLSAIPHDLFTGKALAYRLETGGFLLYSAGENGIDDGGSGDDAVWLPPPVFSR